MLPGLDAAVLKREFAKLIARSGLVSANLVLKAGDNLAGALNDKRSTVALTPTGSLIWTAGNGKIIAGTGTPTITDFPAAPQAGSQREIHPTAGTIITHGGNISVQGNANATAASGDKWIVDATTTTTFDVQIVKKDGFALANISIPDRQTVISGPVDSNGLPNFGGATGSTTVTASGTLIATTANGFSLAQGAINRIGSAANPSWTGLSTNGTMFLNLDIAADGTCTTGSTALAPTYRWGGADVTTNGQFTFNIQEMIGKVGNGATAAQTHRVFVGEVTVAGGLVTAIVWYALSGRYQSAVTNTLPAAATSTAFQHNLGLIPQVTRFIARNLTPEYAYSVGEEATPWFGRPTYVVGDMSHPRTRTAMRVSAGDSGSGWVLPTENASGAQALTAANWAYYAIAQRGW